MAEASMTTEEHITALIAKLKENEARMSQLAVENEQLRRQHTKRDAHPDSTIVDKRCPKAGEAAINGRRLEDEFDNEDEERRGEDDLYYSNEDTDKEGVPKGPVVKSQVNAERERMSKERIKEDITELRRMVSQKSTTRTATLSVSTTRCTDNPFAAWITEMNFSVRFTMPPCKQYDGIADPEDHMSDYKHRMSTCNIPQESFEAVLCRCISSSLAGSAQRWFASLPLNSVRSFSELATKFVSHFSHNKRAEVDEADLYEITQKKDESLRKFVKRFNDAKIAIPECREKNNYSGIRKGSHP